MMRLRVSGETRSLRSMTSKTMVTLTASWWKNGLRRAHLKDIRRGKRGDMIRTLESIRGFSTSAPCATTTRVVASIETWLSLNQRLALWLSRVR